MVNFFSGKDLSVIVRGFDAQPCIPYWFVMKQHAKVGMGVERRSRLSLH